MEIKNLNFSHNKKEIFNNLNIHFLDNKINTVIGPIGVGKSTLLDILSGLYSDKVNKDNIIGFPSSNNIIYKLQHNPFFSELTVSQTLKMFRKMDLNNNIFNSDIMNDIYSRILEPLKNKKMGVLSGGERQVLFIYGICLLNRELYIFDEPFNEIDIYNIDLMIEAINYLVKYRKKKVIIVLHQIEYLPKLSTNIIFLNNKRCIFEGNIDSMFRTTNVNNINDAFKLLEKLK